MSDGFTKDGMQKYTDLKLLILTIYDNIILFQKDSKYRVVILKALQNSTLDTIHSSHWGVVKTKQLA